MLDESRPRRSWTRVEKVAITAQVGVDGATLFDVAQSHGVGRYLLKRWMAQYCESNTSENTKAPIFGNRPLKAPWFGLDAVILRPASSSMAGARGGG
ncbi:transposase [Pseudovibrio sp. Tun.PSC04-5.I4]|uniref:transposase n=1 Tax=Pseudovibrio sp. Tun.PSC04-5.I4 TaxID=1798213 RepID=UPI0008892423|nr:transposase [Pseudovibrio sp. Tun.PSC04-5.I4]SDR49415.1 Transposase [Pseudovibrio sp. Tun.PSC04-5.I4]